MNNNFLVPETLDLTRICLEVNSPKLDAVRLAPCKIKVISFIISLLNSLYLGKLCEKLLMLFPVMIILSTKS